MHWQAQCNAKWPRCCRGFQHPARIEPISPTHCQSPQPLGHRFISIWWKKLYIDRCILQPGTAFFACRIVVLGLLRLNIKARHEILRWDNLVSPSSPRGPQNVHVCKTWRPCICARRWWENLAVPTPSAKTEAVTEPRVTPVIGALVWGRVWQLNVGAL